MPPRAVSHKALQRRLRRTMNYGQLRMDNLTMPLSQMVVDYFDRHNPFDYLDVGYASKLARDGCVDPTTLIVAMVYVDRLRRASPEYFIETSPEDIYLSALVIAGKFLQDGGLDEYIWNDEWAQCSSKTIQRVNELELEILCKIDWDLNVSENEFKKAVDSAETWIALHSLKKNKFLTYNDLAVLAKKWDTTWKQLKMLFTYTGAISATYLGTLYLALLFSGINSSPIPVEAQPLTNDTITSRIALDLEQPCNDSIPKNDTINFVPVIPNFNYFLNHQPILVFNKGVRNDIVCY